MNSINRQVCEHCGHTLNKRKINLTKSMIHSMKAVFEWCKVNNIHTFSRKDIKHLLKNDVASATFGDLVHFAGILYKYKKGEWGMNMDRADRYLNGRVQAPSAVIIDPITKKVVEQLEYKFVRQIKGVAEFCNADGEFIVEYL